MPDAGTHSVDPEPILSVPLDVDARSRLADELASRRAGILRSALMSSCDDLSPERKAAVDAYFVALRALLIDAPQQGVAHVTHWAPSFYLLYLLSPNTADDAVAQAASNLFAMLLCESVADGASPLSGLRFRTRCNAAGELHVFSRAAAVRLGGLAQPHAELEWECGAHAARVHDAANPSDSVEVALPLREDNSSIVWRRFERAPGFNVPILDDPWVAVMRHSAAPCLSTRKREEGDDASEPFLSLRESLGAAYEILTDLLPEVLSWLELFVPAIVEVPVPHAPGARSSGSRLPGTPIHLSCVQDAFGHAEDLIHELQHARYQFLSPLDRYFAAFRGTRRETFVSPYRTDLRPLAGIHLGLHAFLAVTRLRLRAHAAGRVDAAFVRGTLRLHRMNVFSYRTIVGHEQFSPEGLQVLDKMAEALWEQHQAIETMTPPPMVASVETELAAHRARVLTNGTTPENGDVDFSAMRPEERRVRAMPTQVGDVAEAHA
jgi:HEXXH motif-containing protein